MSWLDLVESTTKLKKLYGGRSSSLERIDLHEVKLHQRKKGIKLRFDLAEFPDPPPGTRQEKDTILCS